MLTSSLEALLTFVIGTLAIVGLGVAVHRQSWRKLLLALEVLVLCSVLWAAKVPLAVTLGLDSQTHAFVVATRILGIIWWLALAQTFVEAIDIFVWRGFLARNGGRRVPKLLTQLVAALIYLAAGFFILSFIFEHSLTGLLATSGVVAVVLGLALQTTLADVFTGIAINLERPFRIGDWIRVDRDTLGEVIEHNWRATRIRTRDNNHVILPNSVLGKATLTNYNYPDDLYAIHVPITLGYDLSPDRARPILTAAALACETVLSDPAPVIEITEFGESGIRYDVKCWARDYSREPYNRTHVLIQIWRYLQSSRIDVPYPRREISVGRLRQSAARATDEPAALLAAIDVFSPLTEAHRASLAEGMQKRTIVRGEVLLRQGEPGNSLFIVAEGLCYVAVRDAGRIEHVVARLRPGEFFGEMSLLTGEPRSATVLAATESIVYELSKELLIPILLEEPEVAARLGRILAERRAVTLSLQRSGIPEFSEAEVRTYSEQFIRNIRVFFGLR